jgi:hypothetical protein
MTHLPTKKTLVSAALVLLALLMLLVFLLPACGCE